MAAPLATGQIADRLWPQLPGRKGTMDLGTLLIFAIVYLAMILGGLPGLLIDRSGAALVGAIAIVALGKLTPEQAWTAIDVPTVTLLFGMMVVSAQLRLGGVYSALSRRIAAAQLSPPALLAVLIVTAGALSAVLANDIVCLAMTPVLLEGCLRRGLRPLPFLLALAAAANVGSALTLIGNPQNILIGESLRLDFGGYLLDAWLPAAAGLAVVWAVIAWEARGRWHEEPAAGPAAALDFHPWQTAKGLTLVAVLMVVFLTTPWPRDVLALTAAAVLLLSRNMHSREVLGLVDWQLILLFVGLFVINVAMQATGTLDHILAAAQEAGLNPHGPVVLFALSTVLSNIVSNVPATMLLLPVADHPQSGAILALSSTLAGNLIVVGSIANIIVVGIAGNLGYRITWRQHARAGIPITLLTLAVAAGWLTLRS